MLIPDPKVSFDCDITGKLSYRVFRNFASTPRTTGVAAFINQVKFVNPLSFVTGFHPDRIVFCEMHVVHLGICQWVNAAGILLLADLGYFGPGTLQDKLVILTDRLNKWCQVNRIRPWF